MKWRDANLGKSRSSHLSRSGEVASLVEGITIRENRRRSRQQTIEASPGRLGSRMRSLVNCSRCLLALPSQTRTFSPTFSPSTLIRPHSN